MKQWLIFTDLDGSLLDHDNYSYKAAEKVLSKLKADHIPVIFTTSKTRSETLALRKEMKNQHPFIIENGAAVLVPSDYFPEMPKGCYEKQGYWVFEFSQDRQHWLKLLRGLEKKYSQKFCHFAAMTDTEISKLTGLSVKQAEQANDREYSEPIKWLGEEAEKQAFINELEKLGGNLLQGGRFLNLSGNHSKGKALSWLVQQYLTYSIPCDLHTLALGDSENDISMLEAASKACVIRSPVHKPPGLNRNAGYFISEHFGPKGWAQGIEKIIYQ